MTTKEKGTEIRDLLKGWYAATLSREEEARLLRLMSDAPRLPADLALERDILRAIHDLVPNKEKIDESRKATSLNVHSAASLAKRRRRRITAAICGATISAAALLAILILPSSTTKTGIETYPSGYIASAVTPTSSAIAAAQTTSSGSVAHEGSEANVEIIPKIQSPAHKKHSGVKTVKKPQRKTDSSEKRTPDPVAIKLLTEVMMDFNEDYAEAALILNNVCSDPDRENFPTVELDKNKNHIPCVLI